MRTLIYKNLGKHMPEDEVREELETHLETERALRSQTVFVTGRTARPGEAGRKSLSARL
jgi:hypothetical protein